MDPLYVFAMPEESRDVFAQDDVLHTGIGKVNAAFALTRRIYEGGVRPRLVVNLGTAGSRTHLLGTIVNCTAFIQRDMDVTALGFERFQTPCSTDPITVEYGLRVPHLPVGVCGSGDSFDISDGAHKFDVVDMEAYVLSLICQRENIPFVCLKYISDGADGGAQEDWDASLKITADALKEEVQRIKWGALS